MIEDGSTKPLLDKKERGYGFEGPRRRSLVSTFLLGLVFVYFGWIFFFPTPLTIEQRVHRILEENPLIDGHNDLMILIRFLYGNQIYSSSFTSKFEDGGMQLHVDLPRLDAGKQGGAFWSAFMPCPSDNADYSDEAYYPLVRATLEQLDTFRRLGKQYPKYFTLPSNAEEAEAAFRRGYFISPLAIEGLHQIGNSLSTLRLYHSLGVRYATLTWNCHNRYADAACTINGTGSTVKSKPLWGGVNPKEGRQLVKEMNRLGMIVDLSHVSVDTMRDILEGSERWNGSIAPPIFSHSSAYAICPHPRNVPDDVLKLVKKRNALVMVNFSPDFISCKAGNSETGLPDFVPENSTLTQVARHIMHIGETIGYEHVGIGTDYDGMLETPKGLEDVSKFPDLVQELLERGISDENVAKVVGRNLLRVWHEVDAVAAKLQKEMLPVEDDLGDVPGMAGEEVGEGFVE